MYNVILIKIIRDYLK